jgi:hypothetical protein
MTRSRGGFRVALVLLFLLVVCTAGARQQGPASFAQAVSTFGKVSVGTSAGGIPANLKQVNRYALPTAGSISKLRIFLTPTTPSRIHSPSAPTSRRQVLKGLIYADTGNGPGALLGVSRQLAFTSTSAAGWYDLAFAPRIRLAPGKYWIGVITGATAKVAGFRLSKVAGTRAYNANRYTTGPTNPFGAVKSDAKQISLYAIYAPTPPNTGVAPVGGIAPQGQTVPPAIAPQAPSPGTPLPERPGNTTAPTISGTVQQGQVLTAGNGTWTNEPTSYTYEWLRCNSTGDGCAAITAAASQSYTPAAADVGHLLRVQVGASNAGGSGGPAVSDATARVLPQRPANTALPTISGTAQQGKALTAGNGTWTNEPTSYTYEWLRCNTTGDGCAAITGAASQSYTPAAADVERALKVRVGASNSGGSGVPAVSEATAGVLPERPANTAAPTISGTTQQRQVLTAGNGTWTNKPTSYSYQWLRCAGASCSPISAATAPSYKLSSSDVGRSMRAEVIASNAAGPSAPATSAPTGLVQPQEPLLATVGDIACPGGDRTDSCQQVATAKLTAEAEPSAVAVLGDNQYQSGLLSEFNSASAYNDTWGQFNPIVHPTPGNHEYTASASASGYFTYFGSAAGSGNYSYELGSWHIISLNSDCSDSGCEDSLAGTTSSASVSWLEADLAAHPGQCTLAYWHHPLFTSGFVGNSPGVAPFWNALYAAHADVVVNGHDHMYERFAQQDPSQKATSAGIREFVVGTGGESLFPITAVQPNMQAIDTKHFGVLFLALHPGSYQWVFAATGGSVIDEGSSACHTQSGSAFVAPIRSTGVIARQASAQAPSPAVLSAERLAPTTSPEEPLAFAVRPLRHPSPAEDMLPVEVHCSRACDLDITLQVRHTTIASYRETEQEIRKPITRLSLHLSRDAIRRIGHASLTARFVASDAADEQRSITRTFTLARR